MPFDNIEIPTTLVNNNFSECRDVGEGESFAIYTGILPFYGKAAPLRRNPVGIRTKEFQIDSKVAMVNYALVDGNGKAKMTKSGGQSCLSPRDAMKYSPIRVQLFHMSRHSSTRKLLHHENDIVSPILQRKCVRWDDLVGLNGAWSTDGCLTSLSQYQATVCECTIPGIFAVAAEMVEVRTVKPLRHWITFVKSSGYLVSLVLLITFLGVIIFSR